MARPRNCRRVGSMPQSDYFKPRGIPLSMLEEVVLTVDEFEAVRLADFEGLYQEQAAGKMRVSRPTFGRIVESARKKVAEALVQGKALRNFRRKDTTPLTLKMRSGIGLPKVGADASLGLKGESPLGYRWPANDRIGRACQSE